MNLINRLFLPLLILSFASACSGVSADKMDLQIQQNIHPVAEKAAILETLNSETAAAFNRDYESWKDRWVHDANITKTYIDYPENTFSESVGWDKISQFVKTFIKEHPEPEPVPQLLDQIDVRLYENGAWVTFLQQDSIRGLKRETRLMEKVNGDWKIAGMQTTIYGFDTEENK